MTRIARYAYAILAWGFVVGVLVQVFVIGMALFDSRGWVETHISLGWILHLVPILVLIAAALSRAGREHWTWALGLAVLVFLVPIFVTLRDTSPVIAALHPVSAIAAFWMAVVVARNSLVALREPLPPDALADSPAA